MSLPPILTTTDEVARFAASLDGETSLAVDLEADSMYHYREQVCLLQFSTRERTVLVDPLAGAGLEPLRPCLADPEIRKIFHAADYDIRCLARDFDIRIAGLFDTMISCQLLGEERFGLADILQKYFAVELDKKHQRADWTRRPLPEAMIRYAAEDTCHLHRLAEILEQRLKDAGRLDWVMEECALLEEVRFNAAPEPDFYRFKGAGTLNRRQLAVLVEVLVWRDEEARRRDCPLYKVVGNKPILDVARLMPRNQSQLSHIEGLAPRLVQRYGRALCQAVQRGLEQPEETLPCYPRAERRKKDPRVESRLKKLKAWRQQAARELQLDPGVLINNALLEDLAARCPGSEKDLAAMPVLKNWQRRTLGAGILQALR